MKKILLPVIAALSLCAHLASAAPGDLDSLLTRKAVLSGWKAVHANLRVLSPGVLQATFWKGYESTGIETTRLPFTDWSGKRSLRFIVRNPYDEPLSVYVRISNDPAHPEQRTYTGGTFDGFVIGPGRSQVEISLEDMRSPEEVPVDPSRIAYVGIFFNPLFLRDGMDLKFPQDRTFELRGLRLSTRPARLQRQPYAELLFKETSPKLRPERKSVERKLDELNGLIRQAQARGIETVYEEIYPYLAGVAFHSRLVAFWQNTEREQRQALDFLVEGTTRAVENLRRALAGDSRTMSAPPAPPYGELQLSDRYFRRDGAPILLFGMLYNREGPLLRWFANSQTDYGTELVAGATRHDVERQPIWQAYQKYPETHRVGWANADHIVRDRGSWEVVGPVVNVCLESPKSREAIAQMIQGFEERHAGDRSHLVQNMGYEYTYVCYCDFTKQMWQQWLADRHGSVEQANRAWGTDYASFENVPMPRMEGASENRAQWFDWSSFNLHRFLEQVRWTRNEVRRSNPSAPLTVGSPYYAFSPRFWTGMDEEELADSGITAVTLEENYEPDTLMPEYLHAIASSKPVVDFEYHGVLHQILPSFLHGDAAISMWWWNDHKQWTPNEPINEWTTSFPQSYTIPLRDLAKAMRDALDLRRLSREITLLASAPRPVALLYSKTSMLQHLPEESSEADTFPYLFSLRQIYNASQSSGVYVGLTTEKRILEGDLAARKVLVLPGTEFMPEKVSETMLDWVEAGGTLVVSPDSLLADEYARPAKVLSRLGLDLVRREPPKLKRGEKTLDKYNYDDLPREMLQMDPGAADAGLSAPLVAAGGRRILRCNEHLVMARFHNGNPALLEIPRGKGRIYWLAAPLTPESWNRFLPMVSARAGVDRKLSVTDAAGRALPALEYRFTEADGMKLAYLYNNSDHALRVRLKPQFALQRIVDRREERDLSGGELTVPARETAILEFR